MPELTALVVVGVHESEANGSGLYDERTGQHKAHEPYYSNYVNGVRLEPETQTKRMYDCQIPVPSNWMSISKVNPIPEFCNNGLDVGE